ncbi:transposase family protein [Nocardia miyunensis]|uniref:transposase family protein n=1 Tax=Nocardia miyunensis TaxID=282684 RepID=UPI00350E42E2
MFDASSCGSSAECTRCGCRSLVVHSRYRRTIVDLAVAGRELVIRLMVHRFRCGAAHCERRTLSEQVAGLAARYQRRSPPVAELLTRVGLAMGGRPGARMARQLAVEVSRSTLLALVRAIRLPQSVSLWRSVSTIGPSAAAMSTAPWPSTCVPTVRSICCRTRPPIPSPPGWPDIQVFG